MTAINMVVQRKARAGFIISDGAHTHPDGHLIENSPKIIHGVGRFPWAMGVTGNVHPRTLAQALGEMNPLTYKALRKRMPWALHRAIQLTADTTTTPIEDITVSVTGVVWDFAQKRPEGFTMTSRRDTHMKGIEPFEWMCGDWIIAGAEIGSPEQQLGRPVDLTDPDSFNPESDGLALITAQRRAGITPTNPACDTSVRHRIGADIDLTEVTKTGVRVWKIHEFPDVLGERIRPEMG